MALLQVSPGRGMAKCQGSQVGDNSAENVGDLFSGALGIGGRRLSDGRGRPESIQECEVRRFADDGPGDFEGSEIVLGRDPAQETRDALERGLDAYLGKASVVARGLDGAESCLLPAHVPADQHQIATRFQEAHRRFADVAVRGNGAHFQIVAGHDGAKPKLAAQDVRDDPAGQAARNVPIQGRAVEVRHQDAGDPSPDRFAEWMKLYCSPPRLRLRACRQGDVRVRRRISVSREVFSRRQNAGVFKAAQRKKAQAGDTMRIRPKGSVADDRVAGIGVNVKDRRKVPVESGGTKLSPDGASHLVHQLGIVGLPQERCGWRAQERRGKPGHSTALLVHADQEGSGRVPAQVCVERTDLLQIAQVALEEHDATQTLTEEIANVVREKGAVEAKTKKAEDVPVGHLASRSTRNAFR